VNRYPVTRAEANELSKLTPSEKLDWISSRLNFVILTVPTGPEREALTEANLCVMTRQREVICG
jgi:hypothetical protein